MLLTTDQEFQTALAHHRAGRLAEAEPLYRNVLVARPGDAGAMYLLGVLLDQTNQSEAALPLIQAAIARNPSAAEYYNGIGIVLRRLRRLDEAIAAYQQAIQLQPQFPNAHSNLGNALRDASRHEEAVAAYQRALALRPDFAEALHNLGNVYWEMGRLDEAVAMSRRMLQLQPDRTESQRVLAGALMDQCRHKEAEALLEQALAGAPHDADIHWTMAQAKLTLGDFAGAWPHFPWQRHVPALARPRQLAGPQWQGEPLAGRTILLHVEQGLGDTLQFIRYAPLVAARGGRVLLLCDRPPLVRLLSGWHGGIEQIITGDDPLPSCDLHCPLMSLPMLFATTLATIPPMTPTLQPDPLLTSQWEENIATAMSAIHPVGTVRAGQFRVGIAWAGNPSHKNNRNRSIQLSQLSPLAAIKNVTFFSLQVGDTAAQVATSSTGMRLIDLSAKLNDLADTAALVAHLDLVIAVDTSVGHLAGAMNKPVWLMLPFAPDWRWMLEREDSPWYPSMRLFRQSSRGQWDDVIARVAETLERRVVNTPE